MRKTILGSALCYLILLLALAALLLTSGSFWALAGLCLLLLLPLPPGGHFYVRRHLQAVF
mgnify:CR=1 FL=1